MSQETVTAITELGRDIKSLLSGVVLGAEGRIYPDKSQLSGMARRTVLDSDILKSREHVSSGTLARIVRVRAADGTYAWDPRIDDDDLERIQALPGAFGFVRRDGSDVLEPVAGPSAFDELNRIMALRIEGGHRHAELRAVHGKADAIIGGRPTMDEVVNSYALRVFDMGSVFERVVLRAACEVGGRRYTYDPAFPTSGDPGCARRVRVTQSGGVRRRGSYTGGFEYFAKDSPHVKGSQDFRSLGEWVPLAELPDRHVYGKGLAAGAELEATTTGADRPRPQWDDPFRR